MFGLETHYLSQEEQAELGGLRLREPFVKETLVQLDRILASETFRRVKRNAEDFLGYVIAKKLLGREGDIKERTVAVHAFREPADFDTAVHTKVRVAAANLRRRLVNYYASEGQDEPIEIKIEAGNYVPEIRDRRIVVLVSRFENWNPTGDQDYLCTTVSDDLAHRLAQVPRITPRRVSMIEAREIPDNGLAFGVRGSLERRGPTIRLNISLSDLRTVRVIWSEAFEGGRDDLLKLSKRVTAAIVNALKPEIDPNETTPDPLPHSTVRS